MASALLILSLALTLLLPAANANCYFPNGTDANRHEVTDQYLPCNAGDPVSMCCHLHDECRSDGLCLSTWFDGNVWRDMCTDKTWQSPSCVKLCITGTMTKGYANNPPERADTSLTVTPCNDGTYCCGNGTAAHNCCSNGKGYYIDANGEATRVNPSISRSAVSASKTLTDASVVASVTVTATPEKNTIRVGVIAGCVVAGVIVISIISAWAFLLLRKRKRIRDGTAHGARKSGVGGAKYSELPNGGSPFEVDPALGTTTDHVPDARYRVNAELDGGERFEMQEEPIHGHGQGPAERHELGTQP